MKGQGKEEKILNLANAEIFDLENEKHFKFGDAYKYCEENINMVSHICCGSVQPWYEIPKDIGKSRTKGAG